MSNIFWGALLVLIGLEIILRAAFGINIPILRIAFGLFLIYTGITFISGLSYTHKKKTVVFSNTVMNIKEPGENYQIMFGQATLDFSDIEPNNNQKITVSTLFGSTILIINENVPTKITIDTSFGTAHLPDNTQLTFGTHVFKSGPPTHAPLLEIHAKVSFGSLIIEKK